MIGQGVKRAFWKYWCAWAIGLVIVSFGMVLYAVDYVFERRAYRRWERYSYEAKNQYLEAGQEIDEKAAVLEKLRSAFELNCSSVQAQLASQQKSVKDLPDVGVPLTYNSNQDCQEFSHFDSVLILTPSRQIGQVVKRYLRNVQSLTYPHCRIRIAIGINQDDVETFSHVQRYISSLNHNFSQITIVKIPARNTEFDPGVDRHQENIQFYRRRHLAQVRNMLLFEALGREKWVLWLDSDVRELPSDLLSKLISTDKDVIVPSCMYRKSPVQLEVYDKNSWRETKESIKSKKSIDSGALVVEGYDQSKRLYLNSLQSEGPIVELDGVGACCLLVSADVHKRGAVFPPFLYKNHIETEGFAQAAKEMGYKLYGMPFVQVIH